MRAHAGGLHDAPQGFLAPSPRAWFECSTQPELLRFLRRATALLRERFQLFLHLAQRGGLRGFALLQTFLVGFELLFQRLDQAFDGFLPLGQIALGGFLKFAETIVPPAAEIPARVCFNASALNALNASRKSASAFSCNARCSTSIFSDAACRGFRRGAGVAGFGQLLADLGQFRFALVDLLAQFIFQPAVRRPRRRARP